MTTPTFKLRSFNQHFRLPLVVIGCVLGFAAPLQAQTQVQLGKASVTSAQGQRLKLVVPYVAKPGEQIPVSRIMVESVTVPPGFTAPSAEHFTISQAEKHSQLMFHSRELVNAPKVELVLSLANSEPARQTISLDIPAQSFTTVATVEPPVKATPKRKARKPAKRTSPARVSAPKSAKADANCNCAAPDSKVMVAPK